MSTYDGTRVAELRISDAERVELRALTLEAVIECLFELERLRNNDHKFERRHYPVRDAAASGTYAEVKWTSARNVPFSYKSAIGLPDSYSAAVSTSGLVSIERLLAFVETHPSINAWITPEALNYNEMRERLRAIQVADLPLEIVDRHIHVSGWTFQVDVFDRLFGEMETWWLQEELPVDIVVPILGIDFETDSLRLDDKTRLVRMEEKLRLAIWPGHHLGDQTTWVGMATHAVISSGWTVTNTSALQWMSPPQPPEAVPAVEQFLEALAVVTAQPSGYVQAALLPVGWSPGYVADLPVILSGPLLGDRRSVRLKAASEPSTKLPETELQMLCDAYNVLPRQKDIGLAAARLVSAERRAAESDRVVDLCVGLEALLSDSQGETTYKIALRATAMLAEAGVPNCADFLSAMKTVYAYRSSVVHGRRSTKDASLTLGKETFRTEDVAQFVLRSLLEIRVKNPNLTPDQIDRRILGAALNLYSDRGQDMPTQSGNEALNAGTPPPG